MKTTVKGAGSPHKADWRIENGRSIARFDSLGIDLVIGDAGRASLIHLGIGDVGPISIPVKHCGDVFHDLSQGKDWTRNNAS